jgi:hypothetical protein
MLYFAVDALSLARQDCRWLTAIKDEAKLEGDSRRAWRPSPELFNCVICGLGRHQSRPRHATPPKGVADHLPLLEEP